MPYRINPPIPLPTTRGDFRLYEAKMMSVFETNGWGDIIKHGIPGAPMSIIGDSDDVVGNDVASVAPDSEELAEMKILSGRAYGFILSCFATSAEHDIIITVPSGNAHAA